MVMHAVTPVNILELLDGAEFPRTLPELIAYAEDNDASEDVLDILQAMPDREYESIQDVNRHLSRMEHLPGEENIFSSEPAGLRDLPTEIHDKPIKIQPGSGRVR